MRIAVEEYLLINFLMDFLFLYLASRGTWFLNLKRLLIAALSGSAYALLNAYWSMPVPVHILAFSGSMLLAFPFGDIKLFMRSVFLSAIGVFVFASTVRMCLRIWEGTLAGAIFGVLVGCVNITALKAAFQRAGNERSARFRVRYREEVAEFTAIIDTGNLLREPLSALPVLIADEKALGKRFLTHALTDERIRKAAYASVGGDGQMACLRADEMDVNVSGKWIKAPDLWLGLYPGVMRGSVHALAPPVLIKGFGGKRKGTEGEL